MKCANQNGMQFILAHGICIASTNSYYLSIIMHRSWACHLWFKCEFIAIFDIIHNHTRNNAPILLYKKTHISKMKPMIRLSLCMEKIVDNRHCCSMKTSLKWKFCVLFQPADDDTSEWLRKNWVQWKKERKKITLPDSFVKSSA